MNHDTTPTNEVIDLLTPKEWLYKCDWPQCRVGARCNKDIADSYRNEVARLREKANNWHEHYRDEVSKAQKCKQAYIELEKEVARLCEQIQKLQNIANRACNLLNLKGGYHESYSLRDEIQKIKEAR